MFTDEILMYKTKKLGKKRTASIMVEYQLHSQNQCIYESPSFVPSHLQHTLMSVAGTFNLHTKHEECMYETEEGR